MNAESSVPQSLQVYICGEYAYFHILPTKREIFQRMLEGRALDC